MPRITDVRIVGKDKNWNHTVNDGITIYELLDRARLPKSTNLKIGNHTIPKTSYQSTVVRDYNPEDCATITFKIT